jgi:hypothetical protein
VTLIEEPHNVLKCWDLPRTLPVFEYVNLLKFAKIFSGNSMHVQLYRKIENIRSRKLTFQLDLMPF